LVESNDIDKERPQAIPRCFWDAASGRCLRTLEGHQNRVLSVAWSGDGRHLASASHDGDIRIWDADSGECLLIMQPLPDGGYLACIENEDGSLGAFTAAEASRAKLEFMIGWVHYPYEAAQHLRVGRPSGRSRA
jgi:hypothetical protein